MALSVMQIAGRRTGWMTLLLVLLTLCAARLQPLLASRAQHVCDSLPHGTRVCDPATQGARYFVCLGLGLPPAYLHCPQGLVFNNLTKGCDWPRNSPACSRPQNPPPNATATTTTPTPTPTTTTPPQPLSSNPTTSTLQPTLTSNKDTSTTTTTTTTTPPRPTGGTRNPCAGVPSYTNKCDPETSGTSFLTCIAGKAYRYVCPSGTFFNQRFGYCDWQHNIGVMCVAGGGSSSSPGEPSSSSSPPTGQPPSSTATSAAATTSTTLAPYPSGPCDAATCQLPHCRCVSSDIPGHLPASEVPQMVLVTFDDGVNYASYPSFEELYLGPEQEALRNPNNCTTAATFFVSNDANDMNKVRTLWRHHHEIASHSLTHGNPRYWDSNRWEQEMQGMRTQLAGALNVSVSEIRGMRTPFLELGGEVQFSMMKYNDFTYDTSMFGGSLDLSTVTTPVWPFTLQFPPDYTVCAQGARCPQRSYPGLWEVPLIRQFALDGQPCAMTDGCPLPYNATPDDVRTFLRQNFDRHYSSNRAPFMISLHATWFGRVSGSLQGLKDFLREVNSDPNVWQVTVSQMLDWMRHPVPRDRLHELSSWKACV